MKNCRKCFESKECCALYKNLLEIFDHLNQLVILLSENGEVIYINKKALAVFDLDAKDIKEFNFQDLMRKNKIDFPSIQGVIDTPYREIEVNFNNKHEINLSFKIFPYKESSGESFFLIVGEDLTESKRNEEKVFELDNIIAKTPGNLYWFNKDNVYLGCNETSATLLGMSRSDAVGKDFRMLMGKLSSPDPELVESFILQAQEVINKKQPLLNIEEPEFAGIEGDLKSYLANKVPLFNKKGEAYGVLGISVDITERKKIEQQLKIAKEQSEHLKEAEIELRKAVMILAGSMVHDLRDSITIIALASGNLKDILKKMDLEVMPELLEQVKNITKCVGFIEDANHTMNNFVNDSLKTLKNVLNKDVGKEDLSDCSMWHCIHNTLFRYPFLDDQRKLVKWDNRDFKFRGNELVMFRVLSNLLNNSLQQINKNGSGEIFISTSETAEANLLSFKDTAGGAAPEVVAHLFDGYKTTKQEGTGIGLAFCKMALENFGVKLSCRSELGEYIEFILEFPKVTQNLGD